MRYLIPPYYSIFCLQKKLFYFLLPTFFFTACTVEDIQNATLTNPKNLGQVSFVVQNKTYFMQGRGIFGGLSSKGLYITGTNIDKETISLNINNLDSIVLNKIEKNIVVALSNKNTTQSNTLCLQNTINTTNFSITITEYNKNLRNIRGKFSGNLCSDNPNTRINIENGNFYVPLD